MSRVDGKIAIITGGASGIGAASARLLANEGATVIVTDVNDEDGKLVSDDISSSGGRAKYIHQDVTQESEWEDLYRDVVQDFGRVDVLVNCAGIGVLCPPEEETLEGWRQLIAVNLDAVMLGTKHALRTMKRHSPATQGSIINMSSIEGFVGEPNLGAYNASKGAVRMYTKSVALHCANNKLNIRVNSVHPGYIPTPMVENAAIATGDPEGLLADVIARHPIGHLGEPEDVAYGVVYLASDEAKFMTGSELVIDGGYTAQ